MAGNAWIRGVSSAIAIAIVPMSSAAVPTLAAQEAGITTSEGCPAGDPVAQVTPADVQGTTFLGTYARDHLVITGVPTRDLRVYWDVERVYAGAPLPHAVSLRSPECRWVDLTHGERYLFSTADPAEPTPANSLAWAVAEDDTVSLAPFDSYRADDYASEELHTIASLDEAIEAVAPGAGSGKAPMTKRVPAIRAKFLADPKQRRAAIKEDIRFRSSLYLDATCSYVEWLYEHPGGLRGWNTMLVTPDEWQELQARDEDLQPDIAILRRYYREDPEARAGYADLMIDHAAGGVLAVFLLEGAPAPWLDELAHPERVEIRRVTWNEADLKALRREIERAWSPDDPATKDIREVGTDPARNAVAVGFLPRALAGLQKGEPPPAFVERFGAEHVWAEPSKGATTTGRIPYRSRPEDRVPAAPVDVQGTTFIGTYGGDAKLPGVAYRDRSVTWTIEETLAGGPLPEVLTYRTSGCDPVTLEPGKRYLFSTSQIGGPSTYDSLAWELRGDGRVRVAPFDDHRAIHYRSEVRAIKTFTDAIAAVAPGASLGELPETSEPPEPG